jgi:hypothetical protein
MPNAPRFCLDDSIFFGLAAAPSTAVAALDPLLRLGEVAISHRGGPPELVEGVYGILSAASGRAFGDVLYQDILPFDRDFVRRMQVLIDRCSVFGGIGVAPPLAHLVAGVTNETINSFGCERIVAERRRAGEYYILLQSVLPGLSGNGTISVNGQTVGGYFLTTDKQLLNAYRQFVVDGTTSEEEFFEIQEEAFPALIFHDTVTFKRLSKGYPALIAQVVDHLSFLNDEFVVLGKAEKWDIAAMTAKARVNFSEESGKTRNTERLIKHRRVLFGARKIECTLHTKITHKIDRIHFHAPHDDVAPGKVIVGVLADHLPTS